MGCPWSRLKTEVAGSGYCLLGGMSTKRASNLQQSPTGTKIRNRAANQTESRQIKTGAQKKGIIWKRARISHKNKQDPKARETKQADLDMLELAAAAGEIDLKYLSGVRVLYVE